MTYKPASAVRWITIHYTATTVGGPPVSMKTIDRWHKQRGFREAGYHILRRLDGSRETGREILPDGRFEIGAHSRGENDESVSIVYEGGLLPGEPDKGRDTRTPEQIAGMIEDIDHLLTLYPDAIVEGHRDMPGAATQCPGFDVAAWWHQVQADRRPPETTQSPWAALFAAISAIFRR